MNDSYGHLAIDHGDDVLDSGTNDLPTNGDENSWIGSVFLDRDGYAAESQATVSFCSLFFGGVADDWSHLLLIVASAKYALRFTIDFIEDGRQPPRSFCLV